MLATIQEQPEAVSFLRRIVDGKYAGPVLLAGPEGVGRRTSAVAAAHEYFTKEDTSGFQALRLMKGAHPDFTTIVGEDQKDIGIEPIRACLDQVSFHPMMSQRRFVVIDGADRLTTPAANALLKTLEEPHVSTQFLLLAEAITDVLPTIQSRCGIVRFRPLSEAFITSRLMQHTDDGVRATVYARLAEGSVGRAIQYLGAGRLSLRNDMVGLLKRALAGDFASLFSSVNALAKTSVLRLGLRFLHRVLYDLLVLPHSVSMLTNIDMIEELRLLRTQLGEARIARLATGIRSFDQQPSSINLAFHVKSFLASSCS